MGAVAQPCSINRGRRAHSRLRTTMTARIETVWAHQPALMCDLGQAGARFEVAHPVSTGPCIVKWLDYEAFGDVIWHRDGQCGVLFDELVPAQWLIDTRDREPSLARNLARETREAARNWVSGLRH